MDEKFTSHESMVNMGGDGNKDSEEPTDEVKFDVTKKSSEGTSSNGPSGTGTSGAKREAQKTAEKANTKVLPLCGFQDVEDDLTPRFETG